MDASQIVTLLRNRDEQGMEVLYDNYAGSLNGIIFRIVGSEKEAEDVLQQTFLKIWEKIDLYEEKKSSLFTWMVRIARNSALDIRRSKKFQNEMVTDTLDMQHESSSITSPSYEIIDAKSLLSKISVEQRVVLDHIYLQGYSQSEVAIKLNIPLGTVKSRIRLGINVLRQELKSERSLFMGSLFVIIYLIWSLCQ